MSLMELLKSVGGVIDDDHIVYTSGRHGRVYVNWVAVLRNSKAAWEAAQALADLVFDIEFDTVAGPTHTGDTVASDLGIALLLKGRVISRNYVQETEEEGKRIFPRGQSEDVRDKAVLVVDDILTTGGTIRETIDSVRSHGGTPVAVAVGCNRSSFRDEFEGLPLFQLYEADLEQWEPEECPLCRNGYQINTDVGHGAAFIQEFGEDSQNWPANRK